MPFKGKMTALIPPVGADGGQRITNQSIADDSAEINVDFGFEELARKMQQFNAPG